MSSFHRNERTFVGLRCGFRDCVVAFVGPIRRLHVQRPPIVHFVDERSRIESGRVARVAIVTVRWLTGTWPIQGSKIKYGQKLHLVAEKFQIVDAFRSVAQLLTAVVGFDFRFEYFVHSTRYRPCAATLSLLAASAVAVATMFGPMI